MKRFRLYAVLIAMVTFVACSDDDFDSQLTTDSETDTFIFTAEGGEQSFMLTTNDKWFVTDLPEWVSIEVKDVVEVVTRTTSFTEGNKEVTITVSENTENKARTTELFLSTLNGTMLKLNVVQEKKPELAGYWILSEGNMGRGDAELAWYDASTKKLETKQFKEKNANELGDSGNALKIYGSKMYAVIAGEGFGAETTEGTSYIEVIDPKSGESLKRIPFTSATGAAARPRSIIFEDGKGYITSYSNELVRLDTATYQLDARATLTGTLAEGLAYNNGNIYVCNSGQGKDSTISVVDIESMKEVDVIETAKNPYSIVSASSGVIYYSTNYPTYTLYKLTTDNNEITEIPGLSVADMTYTNNNIYTSSFSWDTFMGEVYQFNTTTDKATQLNLDLASEGIDLLMEYHIGTINGSDYLYLTGMGDDVVIFDPSTQEIKHAFKTGTAYVNSVVAVYK